MSKKENTPPASNESTPPAPPAPAATPPAPPDPPAAKPEPDVVLIQAGVVVQMDPAPGVVHVTPTKSFAGKWDEKLAALRARYPRSVFVWCARMPALKAKD